MLNKNKKNNCIPIIDIKDLLRKDSGKVNLIAHAISNACKSTGFFYIVNHGISPTLIKQVFEESKLFFSKSTEEKLAMDITKSSHMRGYFAIEEEKPEYEAKGDLKEGFDMALDLPLNDPDVMRSTPLYGPNIWPVGQVDFKEVMTEYHTKMLDLGRTLLTAFARGLGMPDNFFEDKVKKPLAQLRLLHYPPQQGPITRVQMGAGEHTDFGCITLLAQDDIGGLEVLNKEGKWVEVQPIPFSFIVNIGDLMSRWTNDLYPATLHRVINKSPHDRYSIVFFLDPDYHVEINCLTTCVSDTYTAKYPPITVGKYMQARFDATFNFRTLKKQKR